MGARTGHVCPENNINPTDKLGGVTGCCFIIVVGSGDLTGGNADTGPTPGLQPSVPRVDKSTPQVWIETNAQMIPMVVWVKLYRE